MWRRRHQPRRRHQHHAGRRRDRRRARRWHRRDLGRCAIFGHDVPEDGTEEISDDVPTDTPPTDVPIDTPPDDVPVDVPADVPPDMMGCTPASCAAIGQICNDQTGECEPPPPAQCTAAAQPCDLAASQPAGFVCVDNLAGGGICREECNALQDSCPLNTACRATDFMTGDGFCQPNECSGFFQNDCANGKCVPLTGTINHCEANGASAPDGPCTTNADCDATGLCGGNGTCVAPECAPLSGAQMCPGSETCNGVDFGGQPIDIGFCIQECTAFDPANSGCPAGEWCFPQDDQGATFVGFGSALEKDSKVL